MNSSLKSPVNYVVLGLVIEKPSYGYEVLNRLRMRYGELLEVRSPSAVYAALDRLQERRLIAPNEEVADGTAAEESLSRQPKVAYRATGDGVGVYRRWLVGRLRDDVQRVELMGRLIAVGGRDLSALGDLVDRYEQECVAESQGLPLPDPAADSAGSDWGFIQRLVTEERRCVLEAQLRWIDVARAELRERAAGQQDASA